MSKIDIARIKAQGLVGSVTARAAAAQTALEEQQRATGKRIDSICAAYQVDQRLSLDDLTFLLEYVDDLDLSATHLMERVRALLTEKSS